jgi:hypothetical protein
MMNKDSKTTKSNKTKKDYLIPSPAENQRNLDEKMAKFLAKGGKIEKCDPMKPTKDQLKSWKI